MKTYAEISGDGGSHIVEQITALQERISDRLSGVKNILAIGSGKGGVGKSTVCVQLALALSKQGERVSILDADLNGPSVSHLTGMRDAFVVPNSDGMPIPKTPDGIGVLSFGSFLAENEALNFDCVSPGSSHTWRSTKEFSMLSETLAAAEWGELDFLLIDLPPGPERTAQFSQFFGPRLKLVLVTIPSALSRGVVARSVSSVNAVGGDILGYISNMGAYACSDTNEMKPMFSSDSDADILNVRKLGEIPFDPLLARSCDSGLCVDTFSKLATAKPIAESIHEILRALDS